MMGRKRRAGFCKGPKDSRNNVLVRPKRAYCRQIRRFDLLFVVILG